MRSSLCQTKCRTLWRNDLRTWLDRPLSIAGRVIIKDKETNKLQSKLINIDRDLVLIPNLAIHMNRDINSGYQYNPQKRSASSLRQSFCKRHFLWNKSPMQPKCPNRTFSDMTSFLYNRQKASIWGASNEFVSAPRLDDLQCVFASVEGFSCRTKNKLICRFSPFWITKKLEVRQNRGLHLHFLYDTLTRTNSCLGLSDEDYLIRLADSFMISADNAHAIHPNHQDCSDPVNHPYLNGGIVIKFNANQKYCTDGFLLRYFVICAAQSMFLSKHFVNRSDMAGGSTLGNII